MSDTIRLRTLSFKSTMKFGKWHDLTVQNIIDVYQIKGLEYLTWCYYNNSNISFLPEVLDKLGINQQLEIIKPGKIEKKESYELIRLAMFNRIEGEKNLSEEELSKLKVQRAYSNREVANLKKNKLFNAKFKSNFDKDFLRRKNQGH